MALHGGGKRDVVVAGMDAGQHQRGVEAGVLGAGDVVLDAVADADGARRRRQDAPRAAAPASATR
ncbi:MAG: hypothetical protein R3F55_14100 [Alphaproteobacteria bacterium]